MIILSRDPVAAEAAKKLVEQIVPDVPEVQIITLKHAQAAQVKFQLDALLLPTLADRCLGAQHPQADDDRSRLADQPTDDPARDSQANGAHQRADSDA